MPRAWFVSKLRFLSWVKGLGTAKRKSNSAKQRWRSSPLCVEQLEGRLTPATVSNPAGNLQFTLDPGETLTFSATSTPGTYQVITSTAFTPTSATGFTSAGNVGTITSGGLTNITVNDAPPQSSESVIFADSGANAYSTPFIINLANDVVCDSVHFDGASTFSSPGGLSVTVARGNITSSDTSSLLTTGGAPLSLTATAGNIDLLGTVNVSGAASFTAGGSINVNNPNNALPSVSFTAVGDVALQTANAMSIGASTITGGGTLAVTAGGNITQTGIITTPNLATFDSTGGSVTLTLNNAFSGGVGGSVTGTNTFSLTNAGALNLADITLGTGALAVTAGGTISELAAVNGIRAGVPTGVGGGATFTLTASGSILLDTAPNNFAGGLVTYAGGANVVNQALRDLSPLASVAGASFTGNLNSTTTVSNVSSFIGLAVGQPITGAGIPPNTTIQALDIVKKTITLSQAATATATGVALSTPSTFSFVAPPSGSFLKIIYDDATIVMPALTIAGATGTISLTSGGDILQTGALSASFGVFTLLRSGNINLTIAGGNTIGLVSLNDPNGDATSAVSYTGSAGVTLGNCNLGLGTFSANASNGNITQADVTFTGSTTNGSVLVTGVTDIAALAIGQTITRTGGPQAIAAGTTIVAIDEVARTITLSQPATRTVAGATLVAMDTITQKRGAAAGTTFTANTKASTFTGNTVNGSTGVTSVTGVANLFIGETVTGTGIQPGTTITAITGTTITLSLAATATGNAVSLTAGSKLLTNVSTLIGLAVGQTITGPGIPTGTTITAITPSFTFTGNTTKGSASITNVSSTAGLVPGQVVSGPGIPANAIIKSIAGSTVTISAKATATATGITVTVAQTVTLSQPATAAGTGVTLTRVGALTFNVVAGGNTVNLTPATAGFHNDLEGAIVVTGAGVTTFGLDNASTLANLLPQGATNPPNFLTLPSTVTDLGTIGITFTNTLALLPNWTTLLPALGSLTVNAQGIYQLQGTNVTGNTTTGSKTVSNLSTTTGLAVGQSISGPGIPAGTTITAINTKTKTLTLSQAATTTGTAVPLTNGTGITVTGVAFFNAGNFPILLNNPNNHFGSTAGNGIVLRNSGPNAVVVNQTASAPLNFDGGNTILGNGTFTVTAPGGITQDLSNNGFRITQAANAGQTLFDTANGAISGSINLSNPGGGNNSFTGITSFNAPQPGFKGTTTSGSPNVTNVSSLVGLSIGQTVTGPGIPIGTTIAGFIGTSTVVLSNAATASASGVTLLAGPTGNVNVNANGTLTLGTSVIGGTFTATGNGGGGGTITQNPGTTLTVGGLSSIDFNTVLFNNLGNVFRPGTTFTGNTAVGSTTVTNVSNVSGITVGETVTGPGIPVNTKITAINGPAGTITLSQAATAAGTATLNSGSAGGAITFTGSTSVTVRDSKTTGLVLAATALNAPPPATFLTVFASGPITQTGPLTNITTATFIAGTSAIILTDPGNDFLGQVNLISTGSAPVAVNDANAIQLGTVRLGTGSLAVNAGNAASGNITQAPYAVGPATTFGVAGVPGIGITGGITETGPSSASFTGNTTTGSPTVSNVLLSAGMFGLAVGESVTGPGIPAGTTITAVNVATNTITLSQNATATATGVTLTATGMVFSTAFAGATVSLNAFNNDILTPINARTTNVTIVNLADVDLSASALSAGAGTNFNVTSTGVITLPTALPANFGTFTVSATQTNVVANLTATSFTFNDTTNFATTPFTGTTTNGSPSVIVTSTTGLVVGQNVAGPGIPAGTTILSIVGTTLTLSQNATASATVTLTATPASLTATTGSINFDGNVQVAGPLNFILPTNNASVNLLGGTWEQGGNNLTITQSAANTNDLNIGGFNASAVFNMSGGTIRFTGSSAASPGNVVVGGLGTFEVGADTPSTTFKGTTANGSPTVTNVSSVAGLTIGQTVSGTGIPAGTTIVAIDTTTITLSQNATASNANVTITPLGQSVTVDNTGGSIQFLAGSTLEVGMSNVGVGFTDSLIKKAGATGNITIQPGARLIGAALNGNGLAPGTDFRGTTTTGSTTVSGLTSVAGLAVGQTVTGPGIASGTTITAVGATTVTLSQAATGSGTQALLTAGAGTVLDAAAGIITGFFDRTIDVNNFNAAHAFLMGSDIAMPNYNCGILTVVAGSDADADVTMTNTTGGVFTTFTPDGDKFTVTASGGGAAGLVVVQDVNGDLGIVYRNSAAGSNTLTLTTSATPGDGFTTNIAGISVNGPGAITITAPAVNLGDPTLGIGGEIRVQNNLTSLTLHNADNFSATNANNLEPYNALIQAGGTTAQSTTITGNLFANVDIDLTSVLNALTVKQYTMDTGVTSQTIEAERFGTITVAGIPSILVSGDLNATLINHNAANSATAALATANIAGTLSGYWDLAGSVGTVTAMKTTLWDLGQAREHTFTATTTNGGRTLTAISSATGLMVGQVVTGTGIQPGTTITGITGSTITLSRPATASNGGVTITALSGSSALPEARREPPVQQAIANPLTNVTSLSLGVTALSDINATGNVTTLSATSWNTQVAITGNTVTGSSVISNVSNVANLLVGQIVTGAGIPANSAIIAITSSTITLNTAATATAAGVALTATPSNASDTIQAKSFGTVKTTGNASIGDIGDMVNVNLIATGNNAGNALSTMTIAGNLDARVNNLTNLVFESGNVGTITVARTVGATGSVNITDETSATSGAITSIQAAAWGGSAPSTLAAKSVGTIDITGSSILLGNFVGSVFLQGTANAVSNTLTSFHAANNVSNSTFTVQNGAVGTFTVGVTLASTTISVLGGAGGTVGTISAAQWNTGTLVALSIGTLKTTGLVLPNPSGAFIAGNVSLVGMNFFRNSGTTPAVGTLSVAGSLILTGLTIRADNGITTFTVGRDVQGNASSIIHVDNSLAGASTVGQIVTLTAGRWGTSGPSGSAAPAAPVAISANSLGTVNIKGYTAPELSTTNFFPGDFDNSTVYLRGNLVTGFGITSFTTTGDMVADTIDVVNGIGTITVARLVDGTLFREENPLLASSGKITTLSAGEIINSSIQANSIGTLKTTANLALFPYYGLEGDFNNSDVTITALTGVGLATFSVAGNMASSTMNIRASLTSFTVGLTLSSPFLADGSRAPGDSIAAGFSATSSIGTLTAGSIDGLDLVTNSLTTLSVKGNPAASLAGSVADSLFTVIGNSGAGKTGIGTVTVTGTVSDTSFNVFNGNVGSVTVGAFTSSALLVGFHAVAAGDITEDPVNSAWNPVNFSLSSFKTTGPVVTPSSPPLAATFTDSLIVAAKLGTITLPGINTTLPDGSPTITFGVGFRKSTGSSGTATIEGSVRSPGFNKNNVFFYRGLGG